MDIYESNIVLPKLRSSTDCPTYHNLTWTSPTNLHVGVIINFSSPNKGSDILKAPVLIPLCVLNDTTILVLFCLASCKVLATSANTAFPHA